MNQDVQTYIPLSYGAIGQKIKFKKHINEKS